MRRLLILVGLIVGLLGVSGSVAYAHVLEEDNGVSGVLHIPPDDGAISGQVSMLDIRFSAGPQFAVSKCNCQFKVVGSDNVTIISESLQASNTQDDEAFAQVTFPRGGVYMVTVQGQRSDNKQPFRLVYDLHVVDQEGLSNQTRAGYMVILVTLALLGALAVIATANIRAGRRYRKS